MQLTDLFIKRPVLATVVSLMILLLGLRAIFALPLRQYPELEDTVITVSTVYPGANEELMQGFVTTPIQKAVAEADGIDYITSTSSQSMSQVQAHIRLGYDSDTALTDIMGKVSAVRGELPRESNEPVVSKDTSRSMALMYLGFDSTQMSPQQITDYLNRVVQPKLETLPGLAKAEVLGGQTFAMRIWLNPKKLAALNISAAEVIAAIQQNNYQAAAGEIKGEYTLYNVDAHTDMHSASDFENMVIRHENNSYVRLRDVAKVELGSQDYNSSVSFNGQTAVFMGVFPTPSANPLSVAMEVQKLLPKLRVDFPPTLEGNIVYDGSDYIRAAIHEVITTIAEAALIVIAVIFLFLGALRTVTIPMVTIPLSLIGVASLMLALGYSLNILTLLAMVLAIGLVVDDAIVVVENIYRHIEEGMTPLDSALKGAREIASPVVSMTITLAAVYAPIGFLSGITGALFTEFAFTLAASVIISGVIALTLSPMMCSKLLNKDIAEQPMVKRVDRVFDSLRRRYAKRLHNALNYRPVTIVFAITVLASCVFLYMTTPSELAPSEDQSVVFLSATAPEYANLKYLTTFTDEFKKIYESIPEMEDYFIINGMGGENNAISGLILKPWNQRNRSQEQLQKIVQKELDTVAGLQAFVFPLPALPGNDGLPVAFVITSTADYRILEQASQALVQDAQKSGLFIFVDNDLKFNKPELNVAIDRNKAANLGVSMQAIGDALAALLGENYVNRLSINGRSYQVIPQVDKRDRLSPEQIKQYYVSAADGSQVPLSSLVKLSMKAEPNQLNQFQQLNSTTIQGMIMPGRTLSEALTYLETKAQELLPEGVGYDFSGQSRQYKQEGNKLVYTFAFAMIIIFLVLAAQFESFRDPFIILISVPMSICGALIPLNLGAATLNIYTQIGMVTLIGLISKHGILMVQFANQLQEYEGLSVREAIEKSAALRLRPILMTTAAMVVAMVPLMLAQGAGAAARFDIGLVIFSGMLIGTLFTLFVVPTMYTLLAHKRHHTA